LIKEKHSTKRTTTPAFFLDQREGARAAAIAAALVVFGCVVLIQRSRSMRA
jgi:hypothetical protein